MYLPTYGDERLQLPSLRFKHVSSVEVLAGQYSTAQHRGTGFIVQTVIWKTSVPPPTRTRGMPCAVPCGVVEAGAVL